MDISSTSNMMSLPPSPFLQRYSGEVGLVGLGVRQDMVVEGDGDVGDPRRLCISWVEWRRGPMDHDRAVSPCLKAIGDPIV